MHHFVLLPLRCDISTTVIDSDVACLTPQTATEYNDLYEATRGGNYSKFHGYAYDGIWVIAKAIDSVIRENGGQYNFRDFRGEGIQRALNDTDFEGVTVGLD